MDASLRLINFQKVFGKSIQDLCNATPSYWRVILARTGIDSLKLTNTSRRFVDGRCPLCSPRIDCRCILKRISPDGGPSLICQSRDTYLNSSSSRSYDFLNLRSSMHAGATIRGSTVTCLIGFKQLPQGTLLDPLATLKVNW